MSKSTGQWIGGAIGAVVGFFVGYPMLGASIGSMIGGAIDPPKGPDVVGPKLDDLSVQTSTYGASIPRGYGTFPVIGNLFWIDGDSLREVKKEEEQEGGKGGGGATVTTYHYYATFAVGLLRIPDANSTAVLRRLWIGENLIYDGTGTNLDSTVASNFSFNLLNKSDQDSGFAASSEGPSWSFYQGSDGQLPDPRMQADMGVGSTSAYPGFCYIVINDLDLTEHYSNTLLRAQIKAEITIGPVTYETTPVQRLTETEWQAPLVNQLAGVIANGVGFDVWMWWGDGDYNSLYLRRSVYVYGEERGYSDIDISAVDFSWTAYAGTWPESGSTYRTVDCDQPIFVIGQLSDLGTAARVWFIESNGDACVSIQYTPAEFGGAGGPGFGPVAYRSGQLYTASQNTTYGDYVRLWSTPALGVEPVILARSAALHKISSMGLSPSYLMAVDLSASSSATILVFSRGSLGLVDTIVTGVANFEATIRVVSDTEFYLAGSDTCVYHYLDGVSVNLGSSLSPRDDYSVTGVFYFDVIQQSASLVTSAWFRYELDNYNQAWAGMSYPIVNATQAKLHDVITSECALVGLSSSDLSLTSLTNSDVRGFRIANPGAVRNNFDPLQAAWPFDVLQSGYKIKFVSRGGSSVATIPERDLGTVSGGNEAAVLLPVSREMDSQISRRVNVKFMDQSREYDIGEQYAERPVSATVSVNERAVDLPLVLTNAEAAQIADVLLSKDWVERTEFGPFTLPPTWSALEPADVIAVEHRGQSHTVRLTRVEYMPDGRLQCNAKLTAAASYTSTATGADPLSLGQSLVPYRGTTSAYLLDIPRILAVQDAPGMAFALVGLASGWSGGTLMRSDDSGNSWSAAGYMASSARVFTASDALSSANSYTVDERAILTVAPKKDTFTLSSVDETGLYAMTNLAAYGQDGRWEIVAFASVTDNTGTYTIKDFLRGMFGSEWATGLHVSGDLLIMLGTTSIDFMGLPTAAINMPRLYRAVTSGAPLDSAPTTGDTYEAYNLKPLAMVDCNGHRNKTSYDWTITAQRRTRQPVELFSGSVVPIGETAESYELDLWDSGYTTKLHEFSGLTTPEATWTAAQQTAETGSTFNSTIYFDWYQVSSVVGRGLVYRGTLTRSVKVDGSNYSGLVMSLSPALYLKFDGNTTTITDSSATGNNGTASASNVTYQQTALFTNGTPGYSIKFTTGYVSVPHNTNLNNGYTVCFPILLAALPGAESSFMHKGDYASGGNQGHYYGITTDGKLKMTWYNGSSRSVTSTAAVVAAGVVAWIAIKYNGTTSLSIYKNGAYIETLAMANALVNNALALYINASKNSTVYAFSPTTNWDDFAWFNSQLTDAQIAALYEEF